jgi:hypothetical protein
MANPEPNSSTDLEARVAQLQVQLEAKPSLLGLLNPPAVPKPDAATVEDRKLKSTLQGGLVFSWCLLVLCFAGSVFTLYSQRFDAMTFTQPLLWSGMVGASAFMAIRLLRARILALEAQVRYLRDALAAQAAKTDEQSRNSRT